jgi:hypothetical protein
MEVLGLLCDGGVHVEEGSGLALQRWLVPIGLPVFMGSLRREKRVSIQDEYGKPVRARLLGDPLGPLVVSTAALVAAGLSGSLSAVWFLAALVAGYSLSGST